MSGSFDPELAALMRAAFEAAWNSLTACGSVDTVAYRAEWARETIALYIIEATQRGERDVVKLREEAITHLANATFGRRSSDRVRFPEPLVLGDTA
jgi:ketopantoate reductase